MNILFDLDGTLTDPKKGILTSVSFALKRMGVPAPEFDSMTWIIGPPLRGSLSTLLGTEDPALCEQCLGHYRERFAEVGLFENKVYRGVKAMLKELRGLDQRLFVATSKPTVYAQRILDHFGLSGNFVDIYGCELDGTRSAKNEVIADLIKKEGLSRSSTLMVGDREHDILGATANGIKSVGVLYGYGSAEELKLAGATALAEKPADIIPAISWISR